MYDCQVFNEMCMERKIMKEDKKIKQQNHDINLHDQLKMDAEKEITNSKSTAAMDRKKMLNKT